MLTVEQIMQQVFEGVRTPRSLEYQAGVRAALERKLNGVAVPLQYVDGTAAADAWYAGHDEGVQVWRSILSNRGL